MKFKTLHGGLKRVPKVRNYLIDWEESSRSKFQFQAKQFFKDYWKNHVVFEEFPVAGTKLSLDFYNATKKIAIEVQGAQHRKYVPHFHGKNKANYLDQVRRDHQKANFCKINDINLIEIYEESELNEEFFSKLNIILK